MKTTKKNNITMFNKKIPFLSLLLEILAKEVSDFVKNIEFFLTIVISNQVT